MVQAGDELVVQVGQYKRNIILPRSLVGMNVAEAKFVDNSLNIRFDHKVGHTEGKQEAVPAPEAKSTQKEGKK